MDYQEIENKLLEFAHKKEGKEYPIHEVNIGTAVDFVMELVKNCSILVPVGRSEQSCDKCGSEYYHTYKCVNTKCENCIIND